MKFLFSSIGKKIQIATSGVLLCVFLVFHLVNNMVLFAGAEWFNAMVSKLELIKPAIRIMEFGLLGLLIMHIGNALYVTYQNKQSQSQKYQVNSSETSSLNSRTMAVSGVVVLLFFILHLYFIWGSYNFGENINLHNEAFNILIQNKFGYLGHTFTASLYIISILLLAFHLKHGFQSALKTFGVTKESRLSILYHMAIVFWGIIPFGFIVIILCIQFKVIQ